MIIILILALLIIITNNDKTNSDKEYRLALWHEHAGFSLPQVRRA